MFAIHSIARLAPAAFALALISSIASALEAAGVLRRSAAAMGATELKSIRYTATISSSAVAMRGTWLDRRRRRDRASSAIARISCGSHRTAPSRPR